MTGLRSSRGLRTSVRVRAALAGGLVAGLGAGLTVASWTDAESMRTTFSATRFGVEQSVAGGAYTAAGPVAVSVAGVYPGSTGRVFVPVLLRTTPASVAGTASMSHPAVASATGLTGALQYRMVRSATCGAAAFTAGATYLAGTSGSTLAASAALGPTPLGALAADGGSPIALCIEFSLGTDVPQADAAATSTVPLTFVFTGTSS